jgi:hypothetical protein
MHNNVEQLHRHESERSQIQDHIPYKTIYVNFKDRQTLVTLKGIKATLGRGPKGDYMIIDIFLCFVNTIKYKRFIILTIMKYVFQWQHIHSHYYATITKIYLQNFLVIPN